MQQPDAKLLGALQRDLAENVATVCRTMATKRWGWQGLDRRLRRAIQECLDAIRAIGLVAHLHPEDVTLSHFAPAIARHDSRLGTRIHQECIAHLRRRAEDGSPGTCTFTLDQYSVVALAIGDPIASRPTHQHRRDYCAIVFPQATVRRWPDHTRQFLLDHVGWTVLGILFQALRQRVRVFAPFPREVSERYWADASAEPPSRQRLVPPWDDGGTPRSRLTATLSLDLRKSTFCMEQADDGRKFAIWMDQLVQILTRVAHHYGGVFDKFTGDGALIHFLEEESLTSYDRNAIAAASDCAAAMHLATSLHINRLRQFLRVDSNMLGATIGIDLGQAHWSLDHRYNPITVGRGVVGACRLSSGPAGRTRLSNLAYQQLMKSNGPANAFRRVPFASKDYNPALEPVAWESDVLGAAITSKAGVEVRQLCDEVYSAERSGDEYDASTI